jgi:hypothetical protein
MFDAQVAAGVDAAVLRGLLARCGHLGEVVGILQQALASDGSLQVQALMPPGLRVR